MRDGRRHYRVAGIPDTEISVAVFKSQNRPVPGKIVDISIGGMSVAFDARFGPVFNVGEVVYAEFTSPHLKGPLLVASLIHRRAENDDGRIYSLEFIDWLGLLSRIPPELAPLFNKRLESRFAIDLESPIEARVEGVNPPFKINAQVRDISAGGLSFAAPLEVEKFLSSVKWIRISFRLPDNPGRLAFIASIRHRVLCDDEICYGIYFDAKRTKQFRAKQEKLQRFISSQHRENLGLEVL